MKWWEKEGYKEKIIYHCPACDCYYTFKMDVMGFIKRSKDGIFVGRLCPRCSKRTA